MNVQSNTGNGSNGGQGGGSGGGPGGGKPNPNYPSTTGKPSGDDRGNQPKK